MWMPRLLEVIAALSWEEMFILSSGSFRRLLARGTQLPATACLCSGYQRAFHDCWDCGRNDMFSAGTDHWHCDKDHNSSLLIQLPLVSSGASEFLSMEKEHKHRNTHHIQIHTHIHTITHTYTHTAHIHTQSPQKPHIHTHTPHTYTSHPHTYLTIIHIWRWLRLNRCRSRWSPYH